MRDPRENPQPGDAVEITKGWIRLVTAFDGMTVFFQEKSNCHRGTVAIDEPLAEWRRMTKDCFVLSRAVAIK